MAEPDPNAATQPPTPEDDGGLRVKVLLVGGAVLFVLVCVLVAVLVATRERGVNKKAAAPARPALGTSSPGPKFHEVVSGDSGPRAARV